MTHKPHKTAGLFHQHEHSGQLGQPGSPCPSIGCAGFALVTDTLQLVLVCVIDVVLSLYILVPCNRSKTQVFSERLHTSVSLGNAIEKPMTTPKFDQFPLNTSIVHCTYSASLSSALIL